MNSTIIIILNIVVYQTFYINTVILLGTFKTYESSLEQLSEVVEYFFDTLSTVSEKQLYPNCGSTRTYALLFLLSSLFFSLFNYKFIR